MNIVEHSDFSTVDTLSRDWNSLAQNSSTKSIFQCFEWNKLWWKHFGDKQSLCLLTVHEDETLLAIAPLVLCKQRVNGLKESVLSFIGSGNRLSDYCDFLVAPNRLDALQGIFEHIWKIRQRWTVLDLINIPEHSPSLASAQKYFGSHTGQTRTKYLYDAPRHTFTKQAIDSELTKKKSLKRHFNRLKKEGSLVFAHINPADATSQLDLFFVQHIARRALAGDKSAFLKKNHCEFFRQLALDATLQTFVRFDVLSLNQKPIAFHFGFEFDRVFYWYKPSFDAALASLSPGEVLLKFLLEDAIDKKLDTFDFTIGSEAFKYRFSNEIRRVYSFTVFQRRVSYWLSILRAGVSWAKAKLP